MTAWSREYSSPSLRGLNIWKPASGSRESRKRYSEVILDPAAMMTNRSLRLRPTPTKNRPSCSWWTSSSSAWAVPSVCRQILSERHDSSTVV